MEPNDLRGHIALVTGASRGIGAAIAHELARYGASVALGFHRGDAGVRQTLDGIRAAGGHAEAFRADVSDPQAVRRLVESVAERFGKIDVLVNNAGVWAARAFGENDPDVVREQFAVNVWSAIWLTQAAARHFPASGARVVNISSNLAHSPLAGAVVYSAAKAALTALTRGFAKELGPRGVSVNEVAPGITQTDMTAGLSSDERAAAAAATALRRLGQPLDIARAVAFLASPAASWISGQSLLVDGGNIAI